MKKHAYLIMAHNQPELLQKLILLLDDPRNDLFIHIDKKAKGFEFSRYEKLAKESKITWVKRIDVKWGHYSMIRCELLLLKEATKNRYDYYHLLSGVDLPLKTQDYIHEFFEKYQGLEFVDEDESQIQKSYLERIEFYHLWCNKRGSKYHKLKTANLRLQRKIGINRIKDKNICFQKGRQWFSITHGLAMEVVKSESWIKKIFKFSLCGDEMFLQTVVLNSKYAEKICNSHTMPSISDTRYIDWERGAPYIFREGDYGELKRTSALFARKFDADLDHEIVEKLYKDLLKND